MSFRDALYRKADVEGEERASRSMPHGVRRIQQRRRVLAALAAMPVAVCTAPVLARAAAGRDSHDGHKRIVVLDWDLTEVVLSLGITPVGVARPVWYMQLNGVPPLPADVVDTGLLYQPNFEVLQRLAPDLIVITAWHAMLRPMLERIAPTLTVTMFAPGVDVYRSMREQTRRIANVLGREKQAEALLTQLDDILAAGKTRLQQTSAGDHPIYAIRPIDARHVTVYGPHGLFGGVMRELGLINAWQGATDAQGTAGTDFAALAQRPDASALLVGMPMPRIPDELAQSPLWRQLPFVRDGRLYQIAKASPTGGPISAMRFATQLTSVMSGATS